MAVGIKIPMYPKSKINIVADPTVVVAIQVYPRIKLAVIVADSVASSTFLPRLNLLGAG